jgi:hypothetical protein
MISVMMCKIRVFEKKNYWNRAFKIRTLHLNDRKITETNYPHHWCSINCKNLVKKTAHPSIIIIGVAQKALRVWCEGPSSQTEKKGTWIRHFMSGTVGIQQVLSCYLT